MGVQFYGVGSYNCWIFEDILVSKRSFEYTCTTDDEKIIAEKD